MYFYGQKKFQAEIDAVAEALRNGKNFNLLFRAPSGYGKTTLALKVLNSSMPKQFEYIIANKIFINRELRGHLIDEVHLLQEPEFLYPLMDSGEYTFVFCSNETGILKEPLVNRCIPFIFEDYTEEDLTSIIQESTGLNERFAREIASNSQGNPRIAKQLCNRLNTLFNVYGFPKTLDELQNYLLNSLHINGGLNELHERYLNFLQRVGVSSLDNIVYGTHIDRATIQRDIEPYLIYIGKIKISSKGRSILE